jgi:C1A family cysteine protease
LQLVGWKIEAQKSYWIVRNSWGDDWGQQGYIYIKMTNFGYGVCGEQYKSHSVTMTTLPAVTP